MYLCYKTPAAPSFGGWQRRAIPLGNGSIGARVFGGVQREMIQFNEKTLFSGDEKKIGSFQNFGEIFLSFNEPVPCSENTYLRDLDLETGSAMVACQKGLDGHTRHYFVSAADNILVGKIEATGDTLLNFTLSLQSEQNGEVTYDGAYACIEGTVNANNGVGKESGDDKNSLKYICCVKIIPDDGEIKTDGEGITVSDTFGARFVMSCATSYFGEEELEKCRERVEEASQKTFPQLFKSHLEDYKKIMGRTVLNICQSDENITTDAQIKMYSKGRNRNSLEALLFEMGKYVLYTSSRCESLPITECGIWNSLNVQQSGEILIDTAKVESAYKTAKMLNMSEVISSKFMGTHPEAKRYNPFGAFKECEKPKEEKKSALSRLFGREKTPPAASSLLTNALRLSLTQGKEKDAYKLLSDVVSALYDNLLMPDIFDNIAYSDTVCKMIVKLEDDVIKILPCLPSSWDIGSITSVLTENGFEIGFEWSGGKFKKGKLKAQKDGECRLYAHGKFIGVSDEDGNDIEEKFENGIVSFFAQKGRTYNLY